MDGRRLRRGGKNPWLVMSESCLNAQRGGRCERERDSKALSRVCAPARGARFPLGARAGAARVPRARQRSGLPRARVRARPGCRAPSPAQLRCAQPPARGSARAARPLRLPGVLPTGCAGGCVREGEGSRRVGEEGVPAGGRGRGWREGGFTELQPGPRCACTSRLLKPKHVPKAVFSASGRFLHPQFPPLGLAATNCKRNSLGGEAGGCGGWEGDSEGWEVNAGLDRLSLSFSADLSQPESCHFSTGIQN
ncbi:uncharacterized protein LOC716824 isoform X1 [Macaca mulatta]|uniref:uncharacterized protein LOC716824 n=1 Tax=Macaca mulatta TaxID=9544 RepID=UPI000732BB18|nr:uncharacterized protein LOC716824 [Macaca mulatta]